MITDAVPAPTPPTSTIGSIDGPADVPPYRTCPPEAPYPASYSLDAECLTYDPCTGVTTLWHVAPCSATTTVAPALPVTGSEQAHDIGFGAALLMVAGWLLVRSARRPS